MAYFPFFIDLDQKPGLVVGGGPVAARKVRTLLPCGPRLTVCAPSVLPELEALPGLTLRREPFSPALLEGMTFVIAATDDRELNGRIARLCREQNIPVNVADPGTESTFLFPSVVRRGPMTIGISTGGTSPTAAHVLKEQIEGLLPGNLEDILLWMDGLREELKSSTLSQPQRSQLLSRLFAAALQAGRPLSPEETAQCTGIPETEEHMSQSTGCVYLIGAGCGQADLITLRGLELLRQCDAVVYDDLIADELLQAAPPQARRIYMGKRLGRHSAPQEEISRTLVELAGQGLRVARLKGGDPFVFGRGGEEALALQASGIPFQVVPGISSAIAIPALAGIPVTHRGLSRGFHVVTAHTAQGGRDDFHLLAQLEGTLVFLMGLSHLEEIARGLISAGKSPETPAAVISGGCAPHPATVRAPLGQLAAAAEQAGVQPPAVILVGETAALDLTSAAARPLEGVRVALVGTPVLQQRLHQVLAPLGARPFAALTSQLEELPCSFDLNTLCDGTPRWLVLTSQNGVDCFFRRLNEQHIDLRRLHACRFAVIGKATAAALSRHGIQADLCPPVHTTQALAQALVEAVRPGQPVYLFRSALGSPELFARLSKHTHTEDIPLYTLRAPAEDRSYTWQQVQQSDYLVFASASGVEFFCKTFGSIPEGPVCVCIGPVTAQAAAACRQTPSLVAQDISASGILEAILSHWAHKRK